MFLAPLSVAAAMLPVVGPFLVLDSERLTLNGASITVAGDEDVELADALTALTGTISIGGGVLQINATAETVSVNGDFDASGAGAIGGNLGTDGNIDVGGNIVGHGNVTCTEGATTFFDLKLTGPDTADGATGVVWMDAAAARVLKVSA